MRNDVAPRAALHVHDRARPADGDRLLESADTHVDVDGGGELRLEQNAVANDCRKPRNGERHFVRAGAEIDDPVLTRLIRNGRPRLLDERRTACLDRHTGQNRSTRVPDDTSDCALSVSRAWENAETDDDRNERCAPSTCRHKMPPRHGTAERNGTRCDAAWLHTTWQGETLRKASRRPNACQEGTRAVFRSVCAARQLWTRDCVDAR